MSPDSTKGANVVNRIGRMFSFTCGRTLPIHITELDVNGTAGGQRGFGADILANASATQEVWRVTRTKNWQTPMPAKRASAK
jgi:hypothetical protein